MRKFLITAAIAAASTVAIAAPASAQYYQGYGYNTGYAYNNYGNGQNLQYRVQAVRSQIQQLAARRILSWNEARGLDRQAIRLQYQIQRSAWNGVNWNERRNAEYQLASLERRVRIEARDGNRGYGWNNGGYGYNSYDRDRDGRDDRYEDDHGYVRDR